MTSSAIVGMMTFLLGLALSCEGFADCGSYVVIGNKAKLQELQKEGFAFGLPMESHTAASKQSFVPTSSERNIAAKAGFSNGKPHSPGKQPSRPAPCSGPKCGSKSMPTTHPMSVVIEFSPSKPLKSSVACYQSYSDDSYFGYFEYSESPFLYKLFIDRPPQ